VSGVPSLEWGGSEIGRWQGGVAKSFGARCGDVLGMEKRSYWWGWTRRGVVVLTGPLHRLETGRGGRPVREMAGGSGLLYFTGFRESNGGSARRQRLGLQPEEGEEGVAELGRMAGWAGVVSVWAGR
jgi:hypothetical protein